MRRLTIDPLLALQLLIPELASRQKPGAGGRLLIFDNVYDPKPAFAAVAQELTR
ncbi:hypothetical protein [Deinococcus sp. UR1]|uniref:hypothetical protein n=1 Tax=Deinococcus sp. UR1 TaxID=1704277 RepID=UPI000A72EA5C|nr:hypothetical protein [Deinococcus sp. UR1]